MKIPPAEDFLQQPPPPAAAAAYAIFSFIELPSDIDEFSAEVTLLR